MWGRSLDTVNGGAVITIVAELTNSGMYRTLTKVQDLHVSNIFRGPTLVPALPHLIYNWA